MAIPLVRSITAEDVPAILAIERESFPSPTWTERDFLRHDCVIALMEGVVAGFLVSHQVFPGLPAEREILNLATSSRFRRLGVATALLEHELKRQAHLFLEVRESNVTAQALYQKFGFLPVGRRTAYYQNPTETAIVMKMKRC